MLTNRKLDRERLEQKRASRQRGFTLIELLVGLALSLLVSASLFWIYVGNVRATSDSVRAARLNNDLRVAVELMVGDIRRAGFWEGVVTVDTSVTPPVVTVSNLFSAPGNLFTDPVTGTDITVSQMTGEAADSCVTYTYDEDRDGAVTWASEAYGFRLNSGAIQMRTGGTSAGNIGCDNGSWESITDPNFVTITTLIFRIEGLAGAPSSSCQNLSDASCGGDGDDANSCGDDDAVSRCCWRSVCTDTAVLGYTAPSTGDRLVETRLVAISLTGEVADDAAVTKTLNEFAKVRNNRALVAP